MVQGGESGEHVDEQVWLDRMVSTELESKGVQEFVSENFDRLSVGKKQAIYSKRKPTILTYLLLSTDRKHRAT